jgi:hypothetical protein
MPFIGLSLTLLTHEQTGPNPAICLVLTTLYMHATVSLDESSANLIALSSQGGQMRGLKGTPHD